MNLNGLPFLSGSARQKKLELQDRAWLQPEKHSPFPFVLFWHRYEVKIWRCVHSYGRTYDKASSAFKPTPVRLRRVYKMADDTHTQQRTASKRRPVSPNETHSTSPDDVRTTSRTPLDDVAEHKGGHGCRGAHVRRTPTDPVLCRKARCRGDLAVRCPAGGDRLACNIACRSIRLRPSSTLCLPVDAIGFR